MAAAQALVKPLTLSVPRADSITKNCTVNPDARLNAARKPLHSGDRKKCRHWLGLFRCCAGTGLRARHGLLLLQGVVETGIAQVGDRARRHVDCRAGSRSWRKGHQQGNPIVGAGRGERQAAGTSTQTTASARGRQQVPQHKPRLSQMRMCQGRQQEHALERR